MLYRGKMGKLGWRSDTELLILEMLKKAKERKDLPMYVPNKRDHNSKSLVTLTEARMQVSRLYDRLQAAYLAVTRRMIDIHYRAEDMAGNDYVVFTYPDFNSAVGGRVRVANPQFPLGKAIEHMYTNVTPEAAANVLMGSKEYLDKANIKLRDKAVLQIFDAAVLKKVHDSETYPKLVPIRTLFLQGRHTYSRKTGWIHLPEKFLASEDEKSLIGSVNKYIDGNTLTAEMLDMTMDHLEPRANFLTGCLSDLYRIMTMYDYTSNKFHTGIFKESAAAYGGMAVPEGTITMPEAALYHYSDDVIVTSGKPSVRCQSVKTYHLEALSPYRKDFTAILTVPKTRLAVRGQEKSHGKVVSKTGMTDKWHEGQSFFKQHVEPRL